MFTINHQSESVYEFHWGNITNKVSSLYVKKATPPTWIKNYNIKNDIFPTSSQQRFFIFIIIFQYKHEEILRMLSV